MPLKKVTALVADEFQQFKDIILENINSNIGLVEALSHHIFKNGGKRVRPLLLLLIGKACGYEGKQHLLSAAAIEYFHTATLLHDDVLDESNLRRGQDTANKIWGSKTSILVGDILLTQSVQFMTKTNSMPMLRILINAAHDITCGEVKQLANAKQETLSIEDYFDIIRSKTAQLFSAAAEIGAMGSNSSQAIIDNMRSYGMHLGNAFQIIDDLLDYQSEESVLGKKPGDDLRDGKITLPLIYTMQHATPQELILIQTSLQEGSDQHFTEILALMHTYNAFEKSKKVAQEEAEKALLALVVLEESPYKEALKTIVNFTVNRMT